ncbi:MAG: T9SS type A sorting domain-containing protein, partial [Ignavibacteriaceae bacterium]
NIDYTNLYVIKTDFDGNKIWDSSFGGKVDDHASDIIVNNDGHLVVGGTTSSFSKNSSAYFINLNPQGQITDINEKQDINIPFNFNLLPNYPNPFNGQTKITFQLPNESPVKLILYNSIGERVAILLDNIESAGQHEITFNSMGLSSGVYLYRIKTRFGNKSRKMILLK